MDKLYVYVFRTISDDPDGSSWIEEWRGLYRSEGPAVAAARAWMELTLADWDDPDASVKEVTADDKFILSMLDYQGDWKHKAIVERTEVL